MYFILRKFDNSAKILGIKWNSWYTVTEIHLTYQHISYPHCAMYIGSITQGISLTNDMAPVMWYRTFTSRICSQGIGMFSRSFNTACGIYFKALKADQHLYQRNANAFPAFSHILWHCSSCTLCFLLRLNKINNHQVYTWTWLTADFKNVQLTYDLFNLIPQYLSNISTCFA